MEAKIKTRNIKLMLALVLAFVSFAIWVNADPTGTTITYNSTDYGSTSLPANRTDPGGSITTMVLNAVQQNTKWKAYIGNITGALTLDDSLGNTIFDWTLTASEITGEVYASRASAITWASIGCVTTGIISSEQTALGFTANSVDNLTNTFNETTHQAMITAGITIPANTCRSTATYVNSTRQAQGSAYFQQLLLTDTSNMVYATFINQDLIGYDNSTSVDFQMILADDPTVASTTYYFYAEIGG